MRDPDVTSIPRIIQAVERNGWAILPEKLSEIIDFLHFRAMGGQVPPEAVQAISSRRRGGAEAKGRGIVVLPLMGVISKRMNMLSEYSGGTSTERFGARFDAALRDESIQTIVIDVDSPGGSVPGVQELSDQIFEARGRKRVIAVANSMMASAAYWIGSAADEVVVVPSGEVGSIGVFTVHSEFSRYRDDMGVTDTVIRAGRFKAEGNPYEPLTEEAKGALQEMVDDYYERFVEAVARNRGTSVEKVMKGFGQGRTVRPKAALAGGMVDRISTLDDVLTDLGADITQLRESRLAAEATTPPAAEDEPIGDTDGAVVLHTEIPEPTAAPEAEEDTMSEKDTAAQAGAAKDGGDVSVVAIQRDATAKERQRAQKITEMCAEHGMGDRAGEFINSDKTAGEVAQEILAAKRTEVRPMATPEPKPVVDLNNREGRKYSIVRAIRINAGLEKDNKSLEAEVHDDIVKRLPEGVQRQGGIMIPTFGLPPAPGPRAAGLDTGTDTTGEELVFTEAGSFIDLLRNKAMVLQLGATFLPGLQGNVAFPKQIGAGTATWVAENPGSDVSESNLTLDQVTLSPKLLQSTTSFSRLLLAQSVINVEQLVRRDLALIHALAIDLAGINGSGTSNQPTGVLNTTGIATVAIGTNGGAPTWAHIVDLETEIATDNADIGTMAILTTPGVRGKLKQTEKASGTAQFVWGQGAEMNGYRAEVSNQVPSSLTKGTGTSLHAILQGVWDALLVGEWGVFEIITDPYRLKKQNMIEVTSYQTCDIAVRYAECFSAVKDADIS